MSLNFYEGTYLTFVFRRHSRIPLHSMAISSPKPRSPDRLLHAQKWNIYDMASFLRHSSRGRSPERMIYLLHCIPLSLPTPKNGLLMISRPLQAFSNTAIPPQNFQTDCPMRTSGNMHQQKPMSFMDRRWRIHPLTVINLVLQACHLNFDRTVQNSKVTNFWVQHQLLVVNRSQISFVTARRYQAHSKSSFTSEIITAINPAISNRMILQDWLRYSPAPTLRIRQTDTSTSVYRWPRPSLIGAHWSLFYGRCTKIGKSTPLGRSNGRLAPSHPEEFQLLHLDILHSLVWIKKSQDPASQQIGLGNVLRPNHRQGGRSPTWSGGTDQGPCLQWNSSSEVDFDFNP